MATIRTPLLVVLLTAVASAADPPRPIADLPFHEDAPPYRIVVDVAPEGNARRMPLMLDTGAATSVMSPRYARDLGVRVDPLQQDPYRRATVLGRDLLFHVYTRRSDTATTGGGFEFAVLGGDFLSRYVLELDFRTRRVRFFDPD